MKMHGTGLVGLEGGRGMGLRRGCLGNVGWFCPLVKALAWGIHPVMPDQTPAPAKTALPVTPGLTLMAMGGSAAFFEVINWLGGTVLHLPNWNATLANAFVVMLAVGAHWVGDQLSNLRSKSKAQPAPQAQPNPQEPANAPA